MTLALRQIGRTKTYLIVEVFFQEELSEYSWETCCSKNGNSGELHGQSETRKVRVKVLAWYFWFGFFENRWVFGSWFSNLLTVRHVANKYDPVVLSNLPTYLNPTTNSAKQDNCSRLISITTYHHE